MSAAARESSSGLSIQTVTGHPWANREGSVDAALAGTWVANIILMAGGSAKTAFSCAALVATDIDDNPHKFKTFPMAPKSHVSTVLGLSGHEIAPTGPSKGVEKDEKC